jgi:phospholipid-binding lipoprotein MlaA
MREYGRRRTTNDEGREMRDEGRGIARLSSIVLSFIISSVLCPLLCMCLAFAVAGCAPSKNAHVSTQASADAPSETDSAIADGATPADNSAETEDEFGLLEEKLNEEKVEVADPLEPVNRVMFTVNDRLYFWVAKPLLQAYKNTMPKPGRLGIRNFFNNITTPVRLVNCLLQGKNKAAGTEWRRFVINTTVGILGLGDPALDKYEIKPVYEDLGQTLGVYGLGNGFYIVWPLLGPSTARDSLGLLGDQFLNPVRYVEPQEVEIGISAAKFTNAGSFEIGRYEDFKAQAFEPYVAMREAYVQYRDKQIKE